MKFRFQSFFDINTRADTMQIIQWSVGGNEVLQRCRHLFGAYKYFKLGKISVKLVPASTLPVDPLGLSYGDSDPQTVDPRDQMNPGLVRITNGEDVFTDVSALASPVDGIDRQVAHYNAMMLDPRWSKFMLQAGFRRSAYPLYWQVGQLSQDKYPGATINLPYISGNASLPGSVSVHGYKANSTDYDSGFASTRVNPDSSARGLFQVGHRGKLGWLPTDYYQMIPSTNSTNRFSSSSGVNNIPEVSVITCVLPKAYKTLYYYRVFITEEVMFSGLRSAPYVEQGTEQLNAFNPLDQFLIGTPTVGLYTNGLNDKKMNNGGALP